MAVTPCAAVFAASAQDVDETVRYAAERGLTVAVQSTGHGALPIGPDSILIHTGDLNTCDVDPVNRTARVGAGTMWQQVLDAATPHGLPRRAGRCRTSGWLGS